MRKTLSFAIISLILMAIVLAVQLWPSTPGISIKGIGKISIANAASFSVGEVTNRTQHSRTSYLGNGKYSIDSSVGPINYKDVNGDWKGIDNKFNVGTGSVAYQMTGDDYTVKILQTTFNAGQIIELDRQDEYIRLQPMALEWANDLDQIQSVSMPQAVAGAVSNISRELVKDTTSATGTIAWNGAYGAGTSFQWISKPGRLVKVLTVDSLSSIAIPQKYIIDGGNPALRLNLIFAPSKAIDIYVGGALWDQKTKVTTFGFVEFRKGTETLWGFMPLNYWDSNNSVEQSATTLKKSGNNLYVSISVPYSWLKSATYPVYIDTNIDVSVSASADDGHWTGSAFYNNATYMGIGNVSGVTYSSFMRFLGITIPSGATVSNCYITYIAAYSGSGTTCTTRIYANDTATPAAPTNRDQAEALTLTNPGIVDWTIAAWTAGSSYQSPDISTVIQELVTSYAPYDSENIQIVHKNNGASTSANRLPASWDHATYNPPALHIEYSTATYDISNTPSSEALGTLQPSSTNYAYGSAPSNPVVDGECTFTITNNGSSAIDLDMNIGDFTGGVGWNIVSSSPGADEVRVTAYYSGQNPASGLVLANTDAEFYDGLAASGTKKWDFKIETGTFTDGAAKSATITITAVAED